jgi:hypothetical protein
MQASFMRLVVTLALAMGTVTACKPGAPTPDVVKEIRDGRVYGGGGGGKR